MQTVRSVAHGQQFFIEVKRGVTWAASGRAETGLILTNGCFTSKAQKEANRDGIPPIELIDGERLVSLFEKCELGLKPKTLYEPSGVLQEL